MKNVRIGLLLAAAVLGGCFNSGMLIPSPGLPSSGGTGLPASAGPVGWTSPPPPEPHSYVRLLDDRGVIYVLGQEVYHEAPGEAPRVIYQMRDGVSVAHIMPDMSGLVLHERKSFEVLQVPVPVPTSVQVKPDPGSRLTWQPLPQGERRVLIPHFQHYDIHLELAPNGRTFAVSARIEPVNEGKRPVYLLDLETAALTPVMPDKWINQFRWSPDSKKLALIGNDTARIPSRLFVAEVGQAAVRELYTFDDGSSGGLITWLKDNQRLVTSRSAGKMTGALQMLTHPIAGGEPEAWSIDLSGQGEGHLDAMVPSPAGGHLMAMYMAKTGTLGIIIDLEARRWQPLPEGKAPLGWQGDQPLCGSYHRAPELCELESAR